MKELPDSEKKRAPITSFMVGIVALVFLAIGYQTALFIHTASVEKILSGRDKPDTVYIRGENDYVVQHKKGRAVEEKKYGAAEVEKYSPSEEKKYSAVDEARDCAGDEWGSGARDVVKGTSENGRSRDGKYVRKNASHSTEVMAIRAAHPPRNPELFSFDPNQVTLDELVRLGFTSKQAHSIINYRSKGGRFRRKTDFARSYVVSEEMYERLEPYIDIPKVDINSADSAALDALPGIGEYFVKKIIAYRKVLHGYSYPEQLMDIYNFDQDKFDGLSDLITVGPSDSYPLWTLPADSLKKHPYVGNYGANGIVLFRKYHPKEQWTLENLAAAGVLSPESISKLLRCRIASP